MLFGGAGLQFAGPINKTAQQLQSEVIARWVVQWWAIQDSNL